MKQARSVSLFACRFLLWGLWVLPGLLAPDFAHAHGFAGKRFFPATPAVDDPFVSDELSLPTVATIRTPAQGGEPATRETEISFDYSKRITSRLGVSIGETYRHLQPDGQSAIDGFDNLAVGIKYQFLTSAAHETILSAGLDADIGGTGRKAVGAESFSAVTPAFFFGKGFGDLPESLPYLKPFAVTGIFGVSFPTRASTTNRLVDPDTGDTSFESERHPRVLQWGFSLEYSLQYLQSSVKDIGLPAPLDRLIAIVEVPLQTPLDRGERGRTIGSVNPGFIWAGRYFQFALEAVIPINDRTGNDVGVLGQLHFFIDDLFPKSLGRPLFAP